MQVCSYRKLTSCIQIKLIKHFLEMMTIFMKQNISFCYLHTPPMSRFQAGLCYQMLFQAKAQMSYFFFSLRLFPFQGLPQRITAFHFNLFFVSSTLTPTTCMSSFTASINLLFGLPLRLLPGSSISSILLPMSPLSLLCTCLLRCCTALHIIMASASFSFMI